MAWNVPEPASGAFRFKTLLEIEIANKRAKELSDFYGNPFKVHHGFAPKTTTRRGNCARCGVNWDIYTFGCDTCSARRYNRVSKAAPLRGSLAA